MSALYWSLREAIETTPALSKCQLCIGPFKGSSQLAEKRVALARIGHRATTWCSFLSRQKRKRKKYKRESWLILVTSHIVLTWTWRITTRVRSTECVGLCQRLCLVVKVDLMFVTAGNETNCAHKIWWERLLAWNIFPQAMLEFNRWNKRIWNHGWRICISS